MYRPVLGARNLDRKKSEGADAPLPAPLDSFASIGWRQAVSSRSSSIQSAVLGGPRARSDAVYARVLHFRSSIFLALRPFGFLVLLRLLSFSHSRSLYSPFSRSLTLYSTPFGSAVLSGVYDRGYVCATKRAGASARTNSRCIVVSECRKVTVQSASKLCSYNLELRAKR